MYKHSQIIVCKSNRMIENITKHAFILSHSVRNLFLLFPYF